MKEIKKRGSDTPANHKCMNSFNGKLATVFEIDCSDAKKMYRTENGDYYKHQKKTNNSNVFIRCISGTFTLISQSFFLNRSMDTAYGAIILSKKTSI